MFFSVQHNQNHLYDHNTIELWRSDGTNTGTNVLISDTTTNQSSSSFYYNNLTNVNGTLFFSTMIKQGSWGSDGTSPANTHTIWKSDGVETTLVKSVYDSDFSSAYLTSVNDALFFKIGDKLWKSDGSEAGTQFVHDTLQDQRGFSSINNTVFFFSTDDIYGTELWMLKNDPIVEIVPPICEIGFDPQIIKTGEGTTLWWWSQNTTTGNINNSIGEITVPNDYKWIYPAETITYTMTANGDDDTRSSCQTTLIVEQGTPPPICEMGADPQEITAGEGTALWWWSQNVASATINNEKWSVTVPSDYAWFSPAETATYTMTAIGDDGTESSCNTTITVK